MNVTRVALSAVVAIISVCAASAVHAQGGLYVGGGPMPASPGAPNATITGYVVDENGRPAPRVMIQVWAEMTMPDGTRRPTGGGTRPTDEQGQFTSDRLQPGEYLVAVVPNQMSPFSPSSSEPTAYPITYYPGVTSPDQAQRVTATTSPQPITIRIRRTKAFHVRGTVMSSTGRSTQGLRVQAMQSVAMSRLTRGMAVVGRDGTYDIAGLTEGAYTLSATVSNVEPAGDFATKDIQVVDRDLDGVTLPLSSGGVINGRITVDPPSKTPAPLALVVMVSPGMPRPGEMRLNQITRPVQVNADWTFQLRGLNGQYRFMLQAESLDYAVVRTVFDGRDVGNSLEVPVTAGTHQLVFHLARKP